MNSDSQSMNTQLVSHEAQGDLNVMARSQRENFSQVGPSFSISICCFFTHFRNSWKISWEISRANFMHLMNISAANWPSACVATSSRFWLSNAKVNRDSQSCKGHEKISVFETSAQTPCSLVYNPWCIQYMKGKSWLTSSCVSSGSTMRSSSLEMPMVTAAKVEFIGTPASRRARQQAFRQQDRSYR